MAATGETRSGDLTQAELAADPSDVSALSLAIAQHEFISRRSVTPCTFRIEFHLAAAPAPPARKSFHRRGQPSMVDGEGLIPEACHTLAGFAGQTFPRHDHLSRRTLGRASSGSKDRFYETKPF